MRFVHALRLWLRALLGRGAVEGDMDKELRFHLDRETELNLARGMSASEAHRAALVAFGGVEKTKEAVRDERRTLWLEEAVGDVRFTLRSLRHRPAFAVVATLTIALAIGATTAIYSIVDSVLFRGIAAPARGRIVAVWETIPEWRTPAGARVGVGPQLCRLRGFSSLACPPNVVRRRRCRRGRRSDALDRRSSGVRRVRAGQPLVLHSSWNRPAEGSVVPSRRRRPRRPARDRAAASTLGRHASAGARTS